MIARTACRIPAFVLAAPVVAQEVDDSPYIVVDSAISTEFGGELYWKVLLTPDVWITPGLQSIDDPALIPSEDSIVIGQIKLRLFL